MSRWIKLLEFNTSPRDEHTQFSLVNWMIDSFRFHFGPRCRQ